MLPISKDAAAWLLIGVQCVGILSTLAARMGEGSAHQASYQRLFFASLLLVAGGTVGAMVLGPGRAVGSGAVLAIMALGAVWDLTPARYV